MKDRYWTDTAQFIRESLGRDAMIIAPPPFRSILPKVLVYGGVYTGDEIEDRSGIVIHKGDLKSLPISLLRLVKDQWKCVFANEVFLIYVRPESPLRLAEMLHQVSFFDNLQTLEQA